MAYYKPYKHGVMNKSQARLMTAVGDSANLRKIMIGAKVRSASAAALLVSQLVEMEVLQAIDV